MIIEEIIKYNEPIRSQQRLWEVFNKQVSIQDKKLAILSCMDTRLTALLPAALGLKNGDAKLTYLNC